jgi:hypothetical protein
MKTRNASWLAGVLFLVLSGSASAHEVVRHGAYPADWSGTVTLYGGSYGPAGWSGTLSYGSPYFYAPGYIPWAAIPAGHRHDARCNHGPRYGYDTGYGKGHKHKRHDTGWRGDRHGHRGKGRGHGH